MAITVAPRRRAIPTDEPLLRVLREFDELPSLRLTLKQAMRLWALDQPTCEALLTTLVSGGLLEKDAWGQFARPAQRADRV